MVLWLPMVPLATNGTIGKISNGIIGRMRRSSILRRLSDLCSKKIPKTALKGLVITKTGLIVYSIEFAS